MAGSTPSSSNGPTDDIPVITGTVFTGPLPEDVRPPSDQIPNDVAPPVIVAIAAPVENATPQPTTPATAPDVAAEPVSATAITDGTITGVIITKDEVDALNSADDRRIAAEEAPRETRRTVIPDEPNYDFVASGRRFRQFATRVRESGAQFDEFASLMALNQMYLTGDEFTTKLSDVLLENKYVKQKLRTAGPKDFRTAKDDSHGVGRLHEVTNQVAGFINSSTGVDIKTATELATEALYKAALGAQSETFDLKDVKPGAQFDAKGLELPNGVIELREALFGLPDMSVKLPNIDISAKDIRDMAPGLQPSLGIDAKTIGPAF